MLKILLVSDVIIYFPSHNNSLFMFKARRHPKPKGCTQGGVCAGESGIKKRIESEGVSTMPSGSK